ncbi:MAG: YHS domain-containing protein [Candidatus Omnitrophota bacterium]
MDKQIKQAACPVCGTEITNPKISATFEGEKYYVCCPTCKKQFEEDPQNFIGVEENDDSTW